MPITNPSLTITNWFSGMVETVAARGKQLCIEGSVFGRFMKGMGRVIFILFAFILALGGSIVGTIAGGIKGHSTENGFFDGAGKGAVTGAIAALQLANLDDLDEPVSKSALLRSLLDGKVFMEWICPAVAQVYLLHANINTLETIYQEVSDIYDIRGVPGAPQNVIKKLPSQSFNSSKTSKQYKTSCCSICFQEFEDAELVRILPKCGHLYHLECIDKWLVKQGSCPICRTYIRDHILE